MAEIGVIIYEVIYFIILSVVIGLFIHGFLCDRSWAEVSKDPTFKERCAPRILFLCVLCYILSAVFVFVGLILYLVYGFPEVGPTATMRAFLTIGYALSLFYMLYVWILRIELTFKDSKYQVAKWFINCINGAYFVLVILALIAVVLFTVGGGANAEEGTALSWVVVILSGFIGILFFFLLGGLISIFIKKLSDLRKVAEDGLNTIANDGDYDFDALGQVQKLVKLQLKLTIASVTAITSSVLAIPLAIINDGFPEFMIYGPDCVIGFICMYCTLKQNTEHYEMICKCCIITCDCCFRTTTLDQQIGHHMEVHSRTLQTSTNAPTGSSGGSGGSGGSGTGPTIIKPTSVTIATTDQATPRASSKFESTADNETIPDRAVLTTRDSDMPSKDTELVYQDSEQ